MNSCIHKLCKMYKINKSYAQLECSGRFCRPCVTHNTPSFTLSASRWRIFPACRRNLISCVSKAMHRFCQSTLVLGTAAVAIPSITSAICAYVPVCQPVGNSDGNLSEYTMNFYMNTRQIGDRVNRFALKLVKEEWDLGPGLV